MKYLSIICSLLGLGLLMAACSQDEAGIDTPTVQSTPVISAVSSSTAMVNVTVSGAAIISRGICYGTSANPDINGTLAPMTKSTMNIMLAGLKPATAYYVRTYMKTLDGIAYSEQATFTTLSGNEQDLSLWQAPEYADDYRAISTWDKRSFWNLANVHDPSVMKAADGMYYMYCTDAGFGNPQAGHGHFHCRRSADLVNWEYLGATMPAAPAWVMPKLNEIRANMGLEASTSSPNDYGYWAPCVRKVRDDLYRMYYAIVVSGTINGANSWSERAFIGLMETATPAVVSSWVDKGFVITNYSDRELNYMYPSTNYGNCYFKYNAIDPSYIITPEGQHWLVYGSWHSGFAAVQLDPATGKTFNELPNPWGADNELAYGKRVYSRVATGTWARWQGSEAPEVIYRNGWYYLFMAYDGLDVPYNTRVVRSRNVDGPYLNSLGEDCTNGQLAFPIVTHPYKFENSYGWVGISHCAVFQDGEDNWYYASQQRFPTTAGGAEPNAVMLGGVRSILWTDDEWPVVMPERYAAVPKVAISAADIAGTWEHIDLSYKQGEMKESETMTFANDGTITDGVWKGGKWSFDSNTNTLTANGVKLKVARECDWEASPRKATLVYAGINGQKTYWGKKK